MENTLRNGSKHISGISTRNGPRVLLACSALIVLASCSADPAASTDSGGSSTNNPAPSVSSTSRTPVPSSAATAEPLHEPLSPYANGRQYPAEELVLSEKGTGTGTYVVDAGLKEGDAVTISVACTEGRKLDVKTDPAIAGIGNFVCGSGPLDMNMSNPGVVKAAPELKVTVETSDSGSFWVQVRVHDGA